MITNRTGSGIDHQYLFHNRHLEMHTPSQADVCLPTIIHNKLVAMICLVFAYNVLVELLAWIVTVDYGNEMTIYG